jgi:hypothetical protein
MYIYIYIYTYIYSIYSIHPIHYSVAARLALARQTLYRDEEEDTCMSYEEEDTCYVKTLSRSPDTDDEFSLSLSLSLSL